MNRKLDLGIKALIATNILVVTLLLIAVVFGSSMSTAAGHPPQASTPASPELMPMGLAHIPTSNSCLLCHDGGGQAGLKPVPALGHPLEGWQQCVVCHTDERLGRTAPGHDGIEEKECQNCHKVAKPGPAITQPHSRLQDPLCLDCHGDVAHLPTSMVGRRQDECWLCHKPTALPPPEYPHEKDARLSCLSCHRSADVGNLPIDHALRQDSTCLLCHDIKQVPSPSLVPGASTTPTAPSVPTAAPLGG